MNQFTKPAKKGRKPLRLTVNGATNTLADWSLILGVPKSTLYGRYRRGEFGVRS